MSQSSLQDLLASHQLPEKGKYISQEFQDFAYRMAVALRNPPDQETVSLCMRLAKRKPRPLLEQALRFVSDAPARNKVALFLWKIKAIEKEKADS